jgi:hypothetical protein
MCPLRGGGARSWKCSRRTRTASAVSFGEEMGLLDDAIREHMELKRLRGADPGALAREEKDVLGRVPRRDDPPEDAGEPIAAGESEDHHDDFEQPAPTADGEPTFESDVSAEPSLPARGEDFANVGQETAEIDMRTVLDEHHAGGDAQDASQADPPPTAGALDEDGEPVEDVLEETPDFLRDTPEQERLWFEQQPPRDFDFDK